MKQTENKREKNQTEANTRNNKYELSTAQSMIDEMKLKYRYSFLDNNKVIISPNWVQVAFNIILVLKYVCKSLS